MGKKKYDPFAHANHNLEAHKLLRDADKDLSDWEITTAFYASLKFLEGSLFPCTYSHPGKNEVIHFDSYNDYKSSFNRFVGGTPHDCMKHFVKNNTNTDIWTSYEEIYDVCHNARYKNYQVEKEELQIAKDALEDIRSYCIQNQK
jgi:hypothetical protein